MHTKHSYSIIVAVCFVVGSFTANAVARTPLQESSLLPTTKNNTAVWSNDHARPADQILQSAMYGPYATMRRAQEVANDFINRGFNAQAFHNGDGYYVRVWR